MNINTILTYPGIPDGISNQDPTVQGDFAADMAGQLALLSPLTENTSEDKPKPEENPDNNIITITPPVASLTQLIPALPLMVTPDNPSLTPDITADQITENNATPEIPLVVMSAETKNNTPSDILASTATQVRDAVNTVRQDPDNRFSLAPDKQRNDTSPNQPQPVNLSDNKSAEPLRQIYAGPQTEGAAAGHENTSAEKIMVLPAGIAETRATSAPVSPTPVPVTVMPQTAGTPEWQKSLGQQLAVFSRDGIQHAQLRLHPEDLGIVHINMRMNNERMQIHFIAESLQARDALENALPHLRQSLSESGIHLGQSHVGADTGTASGEKRTNTPGRAREDNPEMSEEPEDSIPATQLTNYRSGINTFV